jgi:hypothetical protein
MQYASWLLLAGFLAASIAGVLGYTLLGIGIAFVVGCTGGLLLGFSFNLAGEWWER